MTHRALLVLLTTALLAAACGEADVVASTEPTGTQEPTGEAEVRPEPEQTPTSDPMPEPESCEPTGATVPETVDVDPTVSVTTVTETDAGDPASSDYVRVTGVPASDSIEAIVAETSDWFLEFNADQHAVDREYADEEWAQPWDSAHAISTVEEVRVGSRVSTIEMTSFSHFSGAAVGTVGTRAWTLSSADGRVLTLADLGLDPTCPALGALLTELGAAHDPPLDLGLDALVLVTEQSSFLVEVDGSVTLLFPPRTVGASYLGSPRVTLPATELRRIAPGGWPWADGGGVTHE